MAHTPKLKPNGITKTNCEAMKSDDKIKRDFNAEEQLVKTVTDITKIKTSEGKPDKQQDERAMDVKGLRLCLR